MKRMYLLAVTLVFLLSVTLYGGWAGGPVGAQETGSTTPASVGLAGRQGNSFPGDPNGGGEILALAQGAVLSETTTLSGRVADAGSGQVITGAVVNLYRVPLALPDTLTQTLDCRTVETRPSSGGGAFGPWSDLPGAALEPEQWVDPAASQISQTVVISPAVNPQSAGPDGSYGWEVVAGCWYVEVSANGYQSLVTPLVGAPPAATDLDVVLQPDTEAGLYLPLVVYKKIPQTVRISIAFDGSQANGNSDGPALSSDGRYVAFASGASNLVPGDTNGLTDIFVYDRGQGQTRRVSVAFDGTQANGNSWYPGLSGDGRYVVFFSDADNLVPGDTNGHRDVFIHDRRAVRPGASASSEAGGRE